MGARARARRPALKIPAPRFLDVLPPRARGAASDKSGVTSCDPVSPTRARSGPSFRWRNLRRLTSPLNALAAKKRKRVKA